MDVKVHGKHLRTLAGLMVLAAIILVIGCAGSPDAPEADDTSKEMAVIHSVAFTSTPEQAAVTIETSRKTAHKKPFSLLHPPRIYVDVEGVPAEDLPAQLTSDEGLIREIHIEKRPMGYTGVIVYLRHADYTSNLHSTGPEMVLKVTATEPVAERVAEISPATQAAESAQPEGLDVTVKPRPGNRTRLTVDSEAPVEYDVNMDREALIIEIKNRIITPEMLKQLESEHDEGAVTRINAFYAPKESVITLRAVMRERVPYHVKQDGNRLNVDFDPLRQKPAPKAISAKAASKATATSPAPPSTEKPTAVAKTSPKDNPPPTLGSDSEETVTEPSRDVTHGTEKPYAGDLISLEFVDADIRNILNLIANTFNLNIVWGTDVEGKVSMKLESVPWDQALESILRPNDLSYQIEGDVLWVLPREKIVDLELREKKRKSAILAQKRVQEIYEAKLTEFIKLKHRDAYEIYTILVGGTIEMTYVDPEDGSIKMKSREVEPLLDIRLGQIEAEEEGEEERGQKTKIHGKDLFISFDPSTNCIVINAARSKVEKVKDIITKLDVPEKQVLIEARIVEAETNFARDLGIEWQSLDGESPGIRREWYNAGSDFDGSGQFSTNAPGTWSPNIGIALGWLTDGGLGSIALDASLALAEQDGKAQIISAPKVLTVNGQMAQIKRGTVQYYEITTLDRLAVEQIPATLSLNVIPTISGDGAEVRLRVLVTDNRAITEGENPGRIEKSINCNMVVQNGETVVIGGIYKEESETSSSGVPWIKDIPLLGWLFKAETDTSLKYELLIFLTPTVINPNNQTVQS